MRLMTVLNLFSEFNISSKDIFFVRVTEYIQSIWFHLRNVQGDNSALLYEILKDIEDLNIFIRHFYIYWEQN